MAQCEKTTMINIRDFLFVIAFCLSLTSYGKDKDVMAARAIVHRLIPSCSEKFYFRKISSAQGKDCFTIESVGDKILIAGNNANSMAMGLNHYLKFYCLTTVSWYVDMSVKMPEKLPLIIHKISSEARVDRRFFLNYCTYGYTMPWWQWRDWERLIDWMALNGVNMPLAITGQEAVWYKVWRQLGLSDQEIRSYLVGPPYLPWHRMANIDGWNGPLPMKWIQDQANLQEKILSRERELNMRPVLPAFAGHVPGALKRIYPNADIQHLGKWAGFDDKYSCHFLNPDDSLFALVQKLFLQEQEKLFGTDHIYGLDPFNEVDPPSWEPQYLGQVAADIYKTLAIADPKAEWLQMTWMLYFDKKKWTPPRIKALLTAVPQDRMVLLDYHCENTELWKVTEKFHGQPFIWCYLGNFGGNTTLTGNLRESGLRLENVLEYGGDHFSGIGSTLEGLDVVEFPYEYIFDKAWNFNISDEIWMENLADRHIGYMAQPVRDAWKILYNDIYVQVPKTLAILPTLRPALNKEGRSTSIEYSNSLLFKVWQLLLKAPSCDRDAFRIDLITVGRQVLGNLFLEMKKEFDQMYAVKDISGLELKASEMRTLLDDLDKLNSYHSLCSLEKWITDARNMGDTPVLKNYYEKNARHLISTWGGNLNDYASRCWSGLIKDYYAKRWNIYFDAVTESARQNVPLDQDRLKEELDSFENNWVNSADQIEIRSEGNLFDFSKILLSKYEKYVR
jgi:alpha-N-acetylglucosaminidase